MGEKQDKDQLYSKLSAHIQQTEHIARENAYIDPVTKAFVPNFVTSLIPSEGQPQRTYDTKVKGKVLSLDNPTKPTGKDKSRRTHQRKKLTAKEKRELKIYDFPQESRKYEIFLPLHQLWLGYMEELLGQGSNDAAFLPKLLKADYHGAMMTVTRSKCPSFVGVNGIMIQETENTFKIITPQDKLKVIPKVANVFSFKLRDKTYTIYGNQIRYRAAERVARKFKTKPTIDL
ncbi:hypothetical protein BZG36_03223 [Bifiguratus adelaidae]|uniref:Ribonuclease P protein subunit p29 n=1 Tax=Bifiguratus adelaidae TaxID=1938954 RepID=A0A261XWW2_9FUNG|nr:hypothetical protein BZG36_03223 [Bifiguratus adelaidae]